MAEKGESEEMVKALVTTHCIVFYFHRLRFNSKTLVSSTVLWVNIKLYLK